MPGDPDRVFASMGNYIFSTRTLLRLLHDDAADESSHHDFGRDILPKLAGNGEIYAYDFQTNRIPGEPPDADALLARRGNHRRLLRRQHGSALGEPGAQPLQPRVAAAHVPAIRTRPPSSPSTTRTGAARPSTASSPAADPSGGVVRNSVLGRGVRVHAGALVEDSIILDNCDIGRRSKIRRAILDKNVRYRRRRESATTWSRPRRATTSPIAASWSSAGNAPRWTSPAWWCSKSAAIAPGCPWNTDSRLDRAVWLPGHLSASGVRDRRPPVPDETLLTFTGFLVFQGSLSLPLAFAAALAGSLSGITISYTLGRTFGLQLIHRYGRYIRITEEHVNRAHAWFARVGHWGLTFGYFVPGFRHLTAFAAGMSAVEAPQFALFAYSGGCLWVATFLGLGYFLGTAGRRSKKSRALLHRGGDRPGRPACGVLSLANPAGAPPAGAR